MVTFEEFAERRLQALLRYATVLCGDPHLAQDLVQDVLVRVHGRWSRIERYDQPERYVRKAIANAYVSWHRRWSVRNLVWFPTPPESPVDPFADQPGDSALWQRLAGLPRRQRAVLVLRYYEGLSDVEIAAVFGCAPVTVRGHASRALATLRHEWADERAIVPNSEEVR